MLVFFLFLSPVQINAEAAAIAFNITVGGPALRLC
jgi:hypothetical protein